MNLSIFLKLFIANLHKKHIIMIDPTYKHLSYMLYKKFIDKYSIGITYNETTGMQENVFEPNKYVLTNYGKEQLFKHEYTTLSLFIALISLIISLVALFFK